MPRHQDGADARRRARLPLFAALVAAALLLVSGCNGKSAERYQRLREAHPDSYRLGLLPLDPGGQFILPTDRRTLTDGFLDELRRHPVLRVTDADTVEALARQRGFARTSAKLTADELEALGEALDLEGFLLPRLGRAPRTDEARLTLTLFNGYTGAPLWERSAAEPLRSAAEAHRAWRRAFGRLAGELVQGLGHLVELQRAARPARAQAPSGTATAPPAAAPPAAALRFDAPAARSPVLEADVPPPGYELGAEQLSLLVEGFSAQDRPPRVGPLRSVTVPFVEAGRVGGPVLTVRAFDQGEPAEARRFLDDLFVVATPQELEGCRAFAARDPADGRLSVGAQAGKLVVLVDAAPGQEALVTDLAAGLLRANQALLEYYRARPEPPRPTPAPAPEPPRERIVKVPIEVVRSVVPRVEIRLASGQLLQLVRDEASSTPGREVLRVAVAEPVPTAPAEPTPPPPPPLAADSATPTAAAFEPPPALPEPPTAPATPVTIPGAAPNAPPATATLSETALRHNSQGQRYLATSRFEQAEEEFRAALALDPAYESPRWHLKLMRDQYGLPVQVPAPPAAAAGAPTEPEPRVAAGPSSFLTVGGILLGLGLLAALFLWPASGRGAGGVRRR